MKAQKVILLEDISKLGKKWDVVKVKHGYAGNFLFPKKLALNACDGNMKRIAELKSQHEKRQERAGPGRTNERASAPDTTSLDAEFHQTAPPVGTLKALQPIVGSLARNDHVVRM